MNFHTKGAKQKSKILRKGRRVRKEFNADIDSMNFTLRVLRA